MADRFRSILLFGPPGSGKGTQGKLLGSVPGFCHLATGDMFRGLAKESELGREIRTYSSRGDLVPDKLTVRLWQQYVQEIIAMEAYNPSRDILLLDGIPRSVAQAQDLDDKIEVLAIIHLVCPDIDEMVQRMKGRALKEGRKDDADEAVIRRRFEVYEGETAPVLGHYDASLVRDIDAVGKPARVLHDILHIVAPLHDERFGNPLG